MWRKKPEDELWKILKELRGAFGYAAFFSLFINMLMLVPPLYMLQIYDRVLNSRSESTLFFMTLLVAGLFLAMGLIDFARSRLLIRAGNRLDDRLNNRLFDAMFKLSLRSAGQGSAQPIDDLTTLRQFLTGAPLFALFDAPWVPIYLAILFIFHPWLGFFATGAALISFSLALANEWLTKAGLAAANTEAIRSRETVATNLRNAEVVHAMGMLPSLRALWLEKHQAFLRHQSDSSDRASVLSNASKALRILVQSLVLGLGAYLAIRMEVTPGMMIAGSIVMGRALAPIDQLIAGWKQLASARSAFERLQKLLRDVPEEGRAMSLPAPRGRISLEGVVVVPPGAQAPVLRGVSFELEAGETLAVVGPSAAGKSSLARTLLGAWPAIGGKVRLDGADIQHWNRDELGPHIGYLPQDIELFAGTIADNICRFGIQDAQRIVTAAQMAGVHDMILRLPQGYDTPIGPRGGVLSGGQRQRIGLARAVYGNPRVIILDEPNSNLDDQGDAALLAALDTIRQIIQATTILISHRLNVLVKADKILVLREGQLQLFGPRDEVLSRLMPQAVPQVAAPAAAPAMPVARVANIRTVGAPTVSEQKP